MIVREHLNISIRFFSFRFLSTHPVLLVTLRQGCDQHGVNIVVGAWWMLSMICSLFVVRRIPYKMQTPSAGEQLLLKDHASPVGYKVPNLPDFEIDPSLANTGSSYLSLTAEFILGITIFSIAVGAFIIYLTFTSWDEDVIEGLTNYVGDLL
jgi:hypothetical protein